MRWDAQRLLTPPSARPQAPPGPRMNPTQALVHLLNAPRQDARPPAERLPRFRGQRRYFRHLARTAEGFDPGLTPASWADFSHVHLDWEGWGNRRWRYRRAHLEALVRVYRRFASQAPQLERPFQLWLFLSGRDAGEDAVYFHTPNPNGTAFPLQLGGATWGDPALTAFFAEQLPGPAPRVGVLTAHDPHAEPARTTRSVYVYVPGVGEALEP